MRETTAVAYVASRKCRTCYGSGTVRLYRPKSAPAKDEHCGACQTQGFACGAHGLEGRYEAVKCGCVRIRRATPEKASQP